MNLPLVPVSHTVYKQISRDAGNPEIPVIYLKPAELYVADKPTIVRTVLGSCLAVTMFNQRLGVSAICHALLPQQDLKESFNNHLSEKLKYVDYVIPKMLARMKSYDIKPDEIEVKLFGGADMLNPQTEQSRNQPVGKLNIKTAIKVLDAEGLKPKTSDVGGTFGRKIFFYTHTGEVLLKRLKSGVLSL